MRFVRPTLGCSRLRARVVCDAFGATSRSFRQYIRGRVELRRPPQAQEPRPNVAGFGTVNRGEATDRRPGSYLETAPRGAFEQAESARATMNQRDETFVPHVVAITTGTTVDFPNSDRIYHNVFSLSKTTSFDLVRYAAGRSKSVRFDRPGIVRVFCEIHSHMSAFILVFSHPFFATTAPRAGTGSTTCRREHTT